MKIEKVKIVLTIIVLSLIIGLISGCSNGQWSSVPWNEDEIKQMKNEDKTEQAKQGEQDAPKKLSPFVRYIW